MRTGWLARWGIVGLMTAGFTVHLPASAGADGARAIVPPDVVSVDARTLQRMVEEELARQLAGAVEREWQRQLLALANERAREEETQRQAHASKAEKRRQAMQQSFSEVQLKVDVLKKQNDAGKAGGQ